MFPESIWWKKRQKAKLPAKTWGQLQLHMCAAAAVDAAAVDADDAREEINNRNKGSRGKRCDTALS